MNNNNILVVGAGKYQECGIKKLKEKGYNVITVDNDKNCIGSTISDKFYCIDVNNYEEIINCLRQNNIKIISAMCFSTEISLRTVSFINNYYSLAGVNKNDVLIATDKALQRKIINSCNLPCPWFIELKESDIINELYNNIPSYPLIIKPTDSSGSKGVLLINNKQELQQNILNCLLQSKYDCKIIIEEFIPGIEFTVEALIINSEILILGISEKKKPFNNYTVSIELLYNSPLVDKLRDKIEKTVKIFLKNCKFNNTITHTEVIYSYINHKIYIIESTVRSGGFYIFDKILPYITGIDIVSITIDTLLGIKFKLPFIKNRFCILGFYYGNKGKINNIYVLENNISKLNNFEYEFFVKPGDFVKNLETDNSRLGFYLSYGEKWEEVFNNAKIGEYSVRFEII